MLKSNSLSLIEELGWEESSNKSGLSLNSSLTGSTPLASSFGIPDRFILINDTLTTPGDAAVLMIVSQILNSGGTVLLIHGHHSQEYYGQISRKWVNKAFPHNQLQGINLSQFLSSGHMRFLSIMPNYVSTSIDSSPSIGLEDTANQLFGCKQLPMPSSNSTPSSLPNHSNLLPTLLSSILSYVKAFLPLAPSPVSIIIDPLDTILLFNPPTRSLAFIQTLHSIIDSYPSGIFILISHANIPSTHTVNCILSSRVDLRLIFSSLKTGASREIHGGLQIYRRHSLLGINTLNKFFHYRVTDQSIVIFERGQGY